MNSNYKLDTKSIIGRELYNEISKSYITVALSKFMEKMESPNAVLKNTIEERDEMRNERFFREFFFYNF